MEEKYWANWNIVDKVKIGGSMSYWNLSNKIEAVSFRLDSIKAIIELVAENIQDNSYSSPLWGCAEMIEVYSKQLEDLSAEAMELNRIEKEDVAKKATPVAIKATKGKSK